MKKVGRIGILVLIFSVITGSVVFAAAQVEENVEKPIVIKFADFHPLETLNYQTMVKFEEILEEKTNGRVDVQLFPAGQLGAQRDLIEQVQIGTLDMTFGNPPYLSNLVPEFAVMDMPYMFSNYEHVERAADGDVGDMLNTLLVEQEGMRILGWYHIGFRHMITRTTPIRKLEDFKGVKFRSPEVETYIGMFNALKATPTPIPWTEVYQAMSTKIVDGIETSPEGMTSTKIYEVGKYVTLSNHINTVENPIINEAFYQELPEDIKTALADTMAEIVPWQREEQKLVNEKALLELKEKGCEIIEIDIAPLRDACRIVWDNYIQRVPKAAELIDKVEALR